MRKSYYIFCYLIAVILLSMTACRPKGILSSQQMEDLFVDLHKAEGVMQAAGLSYGHDDEVRCYYLDVLKQHNTTQAQFDSSLVWYMANPPIFDKIYPKVVERLEKENIYYQNMVKKRQEEHQTTLDEWLDQCQYGINHSHWEKKFGKNAQKFAYVKNLL